MSMLYDAIRETLKSMQEAIKELRNVAPLDADMTRFARWFGEPEGGDRLSSAVVGGEHLVATAGATSHVRRRAGFDDDGFGDEEEEPARPKYSTFNYGSMLSILFNLKQMRDVLAGGVQAVVDAASAAAVAASATTTAEATAAVYTMVAAHPAPLPLRCT